MDEPSTKELWVIEWLNKYDKVWVISGFHYSVWAANESLDECKKRNDHEYRVRKFVAAEGQESK